VPTTSEALELAQQAQAAAEVLWLRGDREEALARAMGALETTLSVAPPAAALGPQPAALLRAAQLATMDAGAIDEREALVLPLLRAQRAAARRIARAVESPEARRARRRRWAVGAWCVLVALVSLALYRPHGQHAQASAMLARSDFFGPSRAIDGDRKTAWLLPDATAGTLSIELVPARDVRSVRLVQPELASPMRATGTACVRLYRGQRAIAQQRASFMPETTRGARFGQRLFGSPPREREVMLRGRGVTRVEIVVEAWRGAGGGLAEVELR
jgi:hypothetical protein